MIVKENKPVQKGYNQPTKFVLFGYNKLKGIFFYHIPDSFIELAMMHDSSANTAIDVQKPAIKEISDDGIVTKLQIPVLRFGDGVCGYYDVLEQSFLPNYSYIAVCVKQIESVRREVVDGELHYVKTVQSVEDYSSLANNRNGSIKSFIANKLSYYRNHEPDIPTADQLEYLTQSEQIEGQEIIKKEDLSFTFRSNNTDNVPSSFYDSRIWTNKPCTHLNKICNINPTWLIAAANAYNYTYYEDDKSLCTIDLNFL